MLVIRRKVLWAYIVLPLFSIGVLSLAILIPRTSERILLVLFAVVPIFIYYRLFPSIKIRDRQIIVGSKIFSLDDIESVELTGRQTFDMFLAKAEEGCHIKFKNGKIISFADDAYENLWELKQFLAQFMNIESNVRTIVDPNINSERKVYKGSQFFNIWGLMMWALLIAMGKGLMTKGFPLPQYDIISIALSLLLVIGGISYLLYFIEIDSEHLIVRNHTIFRRKRKFRLDEIKEIAYKDDKYRLPNYILIINNDYTRKRFFAATLTDKKWLAMKNHFEDLGIPVRNEAIYEPKK